MDLPASASAGAVGARAPRIDARSKVDGSARYADDYRFPGQLYAKCARAPHAHAEVLSVDTAAARAVPGVRAVLTAADIPGQNLIPLIVPDLQVIAAKEVNHIGEVVAVAVGETPEAAAEAAALVRVEYRPLEAVFDPLEALRRGMVYKHIPIRKGDVEMGFAEADAIAEGAFRTPFQEHAYLETQGMVTVPEADGTYTIYGSMQCPFYVHEAVARILGLPQHRVRVVQVATGGGFGGKEDVPSIVAGICALAAQAAKAPVKLIYHRKEDIETMSKRHPGIVRVKLGARRDGRLTAAEVHYVIDGGAYATLSPVVLFRGVVHAVGPYEVPHVRVDGYAVKTHKVPSGAFRGFGSPQVIFAHESLLDDLAAKLGIDPLEMRRRNALAVGKRTATNQLLEESVGLLDTIDAAERASGWVERRGGRARREPTGTPKRRGLGSSCIFYGVGLGAKGKHHNKAGATVALFPDKTALVSVGNTEMGQGMRTVLTQIAADELGLPYERVLTLDADTSRVPDSGPTVASRATMMSGKAIQDACRKIRARLFDIAAEILPGGGDEEATKALPQRLVIREGRIESIADPSRHVTLDAVLEELFHRRENPAAEGYAVAPNVEFDEKTGLGDAYSCYSFATNVAEVEVDVETGEVKVLRYVSAHDCGRAINKQTAEGQIEGGSVQGLGYALVEECVEKDGKILNPRFATYIIPTAADCPEIVPLLCEHPYSGGPYGAKGLGEPPIMGVAPAVTNAIFDAVGVRVTELPAKPERVRALIREKLAGGAKR